MENRVFQIQYAGLCIGFSSDLPMAVPEELKPFLCRGPEPTDHYRVEAIVEPLYSGGELLYKGAALSAYREEDGTLLIFHSRGGAGCRIRRSGEHSIYVTEEMAGVLEKGSRLGSLINGEEVLLRHNGILLHSSIICHGGRGVLFSGPCGIGKSTQAELWHRSFGDKIINGDRTVIRRTEDGFYGGGSPWCGSSGIYCADFVPLEAIVLLRQGPENVMAPADPKVAFREIYSQCVVHSWDRAFVDCVCDLVGDLVNRVPVYTLSCVPDASAAVLAEEILFRGSVGIG